METSAIPSELAVLQPVVAEHVDGRGGFAIIVAMAIIGLISLRAAPAPTEPSRVALADSEAWMADALPGIGAKTRVAMFHQLRAGHLEALPERARHMARQVFLIPEKFDGSKK